MKYYNYFQKHTVPFSFLKKLKKPHLYINVYSSLLLVSIDINILHQSWHLRRFTQEIHKHINKPTTTNYVLSILFNSKSMKQRKQIYNITDYIQNHAGIFHNNDMHGGYKNKNKRVNYTLHPCTITKISVYTFPNPSANVLFNN